MPLCVDSNQTTLHFKLQKWHSHLINTELVAMLSATASAAQLAEYHTRFAKSRVRFPAGWPKVAFFAASPTWGLNTSRHPRFSRRIINLTVSGRV